MKRRIAILLSGRGSNMEAIVRQVQTGILKDCCEPALVLSNRPEARGLAVAESLGIATVCLDSKGKTRQRYDQELLDLLEPYRLDYLVLAGFMRILSGALIRRYPARIVNIHPADTARFRGLGGYEWAFRERLTRTVITVHFVDEGVDTGPVIRQQVVDLQGADTLEEVERRGLAVEHRFYSEVLRDLFEGRISVPCVAKERA